MQPQAEFRYYFINRVTFHLQRRKPSLSWVNELSRYDVRWRKEIWRYSQIAFKIPFGVYFRLLSIPKRYRKFFFVIWLKTGIARSDGAKADQGAANVAPSFNLYSVSFKNWLVRMNFDREDFNRVVGVSASLNSRHDTELRVPSYYVVNIVWR